MNRQPVSSSNVASVGWEEDPDGEHGVLEVEFKSGAVYQYDGVPQDLFTRLIGASSIGRFLNQEVLSVFDATRVR